MPRLLCLLLLALLACGNAPARTPDQAAAPTILYLTRHAEKAAGDDPDLLPTGQLRAQHLADRLASKGIDAIYATDFRRTRATAAPLAQRLKLEVRPYPADRPAAEQTSTWVADHTGQRLLIVGHSNTVPDLVNALIGEDRYSDLGEDIYDRLYRVELRGDGSATVDVLTTSATPE